MAPPIDPPTAITLRVKVPPGHIPGNADEFTLGNDIAVNLKIGQIRERIQEAIPASPTPERQRLLYGGRALVDNDQTVADALNIRRAPTQNEYVVHLLIKGSGEATAPIPHRTGLNTPNRSGSPAGTSPQPPGAPYLPPQRPHDPNAVSPIQLQHAHPGFSPHAHPPGYASPILQQHIQQHQTAVLAQQQRLHAQMAQNPNPLAPHNGLVPFGFQPMNLGPLDLATMQQLQAEQQQQQQQQQQILMGGAGYIPLRGPAPGQGLPRADHNDGTTGSTGVNAQQDTTQQADASSHEQQQPGQENHAHQHPAPQRPTSEEHHVEGVPPNVQRITIRQQVVHYPNGQVAAQQIPFDENMTPPQFAGLGLPPLPGMPPQQHGPPQRSSALEQARDNIVEMRRMLTELRDLNVEEHRAQIDRLEERTQAVNNYIDPFNLHGTAHGNDRGVSMATPVGIPQQGQPAFGSRAATPFGQQASWQQRARQMRSAQQPASRTGSDVTCYLLSSPSGPQAILYSPQHGTFTGQLPHIQPLVPSDLLPTPTTTVAQAGAGQGQDNQQGQAHAAAQVPAQGQAAAAAANPLGPIEPFMGHVWLLLRVLVFSYFLLGTNMGWQRPLALLAIGGAFWMIRMGLLGDGGALRRWWDGIVHEGQQRAPAAEQPGAGGQAQPGQQQNQDQAQPGGAARPAQMPTPAQVAQRLLDEEQRQRNANRDQRLQWLREQARPFERALALLVASLWPGVGEAYVRAREQEERRRAEEEVAARRAEEEERQRREEEEKTKTEGEEKSESTSDPTTTSDAATGSGKQEESSSAQAAIQS